MNKNDFKLMDDCIGKTMNNWDGEFNNAEIYDVCSIEDTGISESQAKELLMLSRIEKMRATMHREKPIVNGELFSESYQDRLLVHGDTSVKVRDCTWQWHLRHREDQVEAMNKSAAKFDIDEIRRDELGPTMSVNPDMRTGEAIEKLGLNHEDKTA